MAALIVSLHLTTQLASLASQVLFSSKAYSPGAEPYICAQVLKFKFRSLDSQGKHLMTESHSLPSQWDMVTIKV